MSFANWVRSRRVNSTSYVSDSWLAAAANDRLNSAWAWSCLCSVCWHVSCRFVSVRLPIRAKSNCHFFFYNHSVFFFLLLSRNTFLAVTRIVWCSIQLYTYHHLSALVGLVRFHAYEISIRKWNVNRAEQCGQHRVVEAHKWQSSECVNAHLGHFGWIENCSVKSIELFIQFRVVYFWRACTDRSLFWIF